LYFYISLQNMENKTIARSLRLLSQLMELHEENPFKIKSLANAAFKVDKLPYPLNGKNLAELEKIDGIGNSTAQKISALLANGTTPELQDLLKATPDGIVEMLGIKGIGPKKILTIWKDLAIENVGELYYACNENRLIEARGFGIKTQEEIRRLLEFRMANNGKFLYTQVDELADEINAQLKKHMPEAQIAISGDFRRRCEIISELVFVIGTENVSEGLEKLKDITILKHNTTIGENWSGETDNGLLVNISFCNPVDFYDSLFENTGNDDHVQAVRSLIADQHWKAANEEALYAKAGLAFIPPELREGSNYIELAQKNSLPQLIEFNDLKGTLHNHSTWSDGVNTLEEMALFCQNSLNLEYLGICDHSKSAFYANGLSIERVLQQHEEINKLNQQLKGFHIFKGIESDILNDGSLDYPDEILAKFDFVVASVHSNLKMIEEKATERIIKAVENPYTTILGHPTGRLLLSRKGYPIDHKKVIDACAANEVIIEINANPFRLDLDWRWQKYALEKGVLLAVNPDAHRTKAKCLNAFSLAEVSELFNRFKKKQVEQHK
jgi:DNA polymerase (family 10)